LPTCARFASSPGAQCSLHLPSLGGLESTARSAATCTLLHISHPIHLHVDPFYNFDRPVHGCLRNPLTGSITRYTNHVLSFLALHLINSKQRPTATWRRPDGRPVNLILTPLYLAFPPFVPLRPKVAPLAPTFPPLLTTRYHPLQPVHHLTTTVLFHFTPGFSLSTNTSHHWTPHRCLLPMHTSRDVQGICHTEGSSTEVCLPPLVVVSDLLAGSSGELR